jgi:hypothetical protein
MWKFEGLVRDILRSALIRIPATDADRKAFLDGLAAMSDTEHLHRIRNTASQMRNTLLRKEILKAISGRLATSATGEG